MKSIHGLMLFVLLAVFSACSPTVSTTINKSYPELEYAQDVLVIGLDQEDPENAEVLGQVKIGDSGFSTNCNYDVVLGKAKLEARKIGGNAIRIVEHKSPSAMGSSCHRITATILNIDNIENFAAVSKAEDELLDVDYAILNVYRYGGAGALVGYDLFLGDSVVCRVKNNFKTTIHLNKDGLNTLWAKTEAKEEVPINVIMGKTYYLRCSLGMGVFVGQPKMELVESYIGQSEFESFKAKNQ